MSTKVYRIGQAWPEAARIEHLGPRRFRLADTVVLEMPEGVLEAVGTRVGGLSVAMFDFSTVPGKADERPAVFAHARWEFDGPSFPRLLLPVIPDVAEHGAEGPSARHDAGYRLAKYGIIPMRHRAAIDRAWRLDCAAMQDVRTGPGRTFIARAWHRFRPWRFWLGVRLGGRSAFKPRYILKGIQK